MPRKALPNWRDAERLCFHRRVKETMIEKETARGRPDGIVTGTVLIVDDTESNQYLLGRYLAAAGFSVVKATTGTEGIERARELPDLIVLDVKLPDMSGFEVCRALRRDARTERVPVLHVSASFTDVGDRVRGLEGGADGYLVHPVNPTELVAVSRALIRARRIESRVADAAGHAVGETDPAPAPSWVGRALTRLQTQHGLTPAERLVVEQSVRGLSNKEIARVLGLSVSTVRAQLLSASKRLDVRSRGELAYLVFCESYRPER